MTSMPFSQRTRVNPTPNMIVPATDPNAGTGLKDVAFTVSALLAQMAEAQSGSQIYSGAASPSELLGNNGDYYIDTSNGSLFGPKAAGLWPTTPIALTSAADATLAAAITAETTRAMAAEQLLAPKASPPLTGTPTAPTAAPLTGNTQVATTAYADAAVAVEAANRVAAVGVTVAPLVGGTVPLANMSPGILGAPHYVGMWNAATNSPALSSGVAPAGPQPTGSYYVVSTAGVMALDGISSWNVGDWVLWSGTAWEKLDGQANPVSSVAGLQGSVSATALAAALGLTAPATAPFGTAAGTVADGGATAAALAGKQALLAAGSAGQFYTASGAAGAPALVSGNTAGGPLLLDANGNVSGQVLGANLAAYPTVAALQTATPGTLSGELYIRVLGYANPGDGGDGWLVLTTPTATPNNITIYNDASGNSWSRLFSGNLNVCWSGAGLSDGTLDDSVRIQKTHNLALSLGVGVDFPNKVYYVLNNAGNPNSALLWDLRVPARALGQVILVTNISTGNFIQLATPLPLGNQWFADVFSGAFFFENNYGVSATTTCFYVGQVPGESQSRLGADFNIKGVTLSGWGTCVIFGTNAYTMQFEDCFFKDSGYSGTLLSVAVGYSNSGERISFYGCDFAGNYSPVISNVGVTNALGTFEWNFTQCSIDYNAQTTLDYNFFNIQAASVSIYTSQCHFEWGYGPTTLTNASITGTTLSCANANLPIGAIILDTAALVMAGTVITANLGGGNYTVNNSQTVAAETMTANCPIKLWNLSGSHAYNTVILRDSVYVSLSGGIWQSISTNASAVIIHGIRYSAAQFANPVTFLYFAGNGPSVADIDDQSFALNAASVDAIATWVSQPSNLTYLNSQMTRLSKSNTVSANATITSLQSGQTFEIAYAGTAAFTVTLQGYAGSYYRFVGSVAATGYTVLLQGYHNIWLPGASAAVNSVANFIAPGQVVDVWIDGTNAWVSTNYKSSAAWVGGYGVVTGVSTGAYQYTATAPGFLQIYGGTISAITSKRGSTTISWNVSANMIPVAVGDIVTVTNTAVPTLTFVPA